MCLELYSAVTYWMWCDVMDVMDVMWMRMLCPGFFSECGRVSPVCRHLRTGQWLKGQAIDLLRIRRKAACRSDVHGFISFGIEPTFIVSGKIQKGVLTVDSALQESQPKLFCCCCFHIFLCGSVSCPEAFPASTECSPVALQGSGHIVRSLSLLVY